VNPKLLWVRSFAEIYNPMLAIEILQELIKRGHEASLCMVGPDKDGSLDLCKKVASENGLDVTFTGGLSKQQWTTLASEYDIFLNTTNFDNMPVSVIEAMALGMVVVSTNVGGLPFLLKDGEDALLLPPGDRYAFADAIEQLLEDDEKVETISRNARQKAESFDWKIVKLQWLNLLQD
jgi:glycosyltransferase involved in cell wall biosynthesis